MQQATKAVRSLSLTGTHPKGRENEPITLTTQSENPNNADKARTRTKGQVSIARNGAIPKHPKGLKGKNPKVTGPCKGVSRSAPRSIMNEDEEEKENEEKENEETDTLGSEPNEGPEEKGGEIKTPSELSEILQRVEVTDRDQARLMSEFLHGNEIKGPEPINWEQNETQPLNEANPTGRTRVKQPFEQLQYWAEHSDVIPYLWTRRSGVRPSS
jgi:hypothetical protein